MTPIVLINITVSPAQEEMFVDWLLQFDMQGGFSSFPLNGHSNRHDDLTVAEQVAGRKKQVRFQIHLPEKESAPFLEQLKTDFKGTGLHYWISPVLEAGHV